MRGNLGKVNELYPAPDARGAAGTGPVAAVYRLRGSQPARRAVSGVQGRRCRGAPRGAPAPLARLPALLGRFIRPRAVAVRGAHAARAAVANPAPALTAYTVQQFGLCICPHAQAEDKQGETPLSAAAAITGLREALVDLVTGKTSIEDMLEE